MRTVRMTIDDIPELPGYLTVPQVVSMYGITRGGVYNMIYNQGAFTKVFKLHSSEGSERLTLLLDEKEVEEVFFRRMVKPVSNGKLKIERGQWNRRVKDWGRETGWNERPINVEGRPPVELVEAYLEANPTDVQPG